ncbi:hypothetical protein Vqi01_55400 [Micromonospora qiuiae]|uniref:Uncharacterized protein n=1 Tax=Micromonospora qiuiae TaxID=502268 RepID=A0ABQ4JIE4_9ACTN|nr:hypothetical protein Vqi01_55400 [Micromonospora qiuiae]
MVAGAHACPRRVRAGDGSRCGVRDLVHPGLAAGYFPLHADRVEGGDFVVRKFFLADLARRIGDKQLNLAQAIEEAK